jgi:hypothetical protein
MTFHTPEGWVKKAMMRDDRAEHQIRLTTQPHRAWQLFVGCTCLGVDEDRRRSRYLVEITDADEALRIWREHMRTADPT